MINLSPPIIYVNSNKALIDACKSLSKSAFIAIDTEFIRKNTYYPLPALCQIYDNKTVYLIDWVEIQDNTPLKNLLENTEITKILHSAQGDLEIFSLFNIELNNLFDTQIAESFLQNTNTPFSYSQVVLQYCEITLDKQENRSDWLQRPLSDKQIEYAIFDVLALPFIYETQLQRLQKKNYLSALKEEMSSFLTNYQEFISPKLYAKKRIPHYLKLTTDKQALLSALCEWREKQCANNNQLRKKVLSDQQCIEIIDTKKNNEALIAILTTTQYHLFGKEILHLLETHKPTESIDAHSTTTIDRNTQKKWLSHLMKLSNELASEYNIAQQLLGRKKELSLTIHHYSIYHQLPNNMLGWRYPIIGHKIEQFLQSNLLQR